MVKEKTPKADPGSDGEIEATLLAGYFSEDTLSVHLKEGCKPMAKVGSVEAVQLVEIDDNELDREGLEDVLREVLDLARSRRDSSIEIEHEGGTVIQLGPFRVAAAMPPFADGLEVTAVRQVKQLDLDEYGLDPRLIEHLEDYHRGVLVSGRPGDGKTTFSRAVAMHLRSKGAIVKTMESPRDMVLPDDITQYAPLDGSWELTAELLLMVRPDFVVFDEVRKTEDFQVYADMRLAGVGLVGVVHANSAVNAIQRLLGRVELGLLPQIVDTVLHLEKGRVAQALRLVPTVKVPEGMFEQDLARPVVVVEDFYSGEPAFEMYTYGDQLVVMPIASGGTSDRGRARGVQRRPVVSEEEIVSRLQALVVGPVDVEIPVPGRARVFVGSGDASNIIGKGGRTVRELENELGVRIDVVTEGSPAQGRRSASRQRLTDFSTRETKNNIVIYVPSQFSGRLAEIDVGGRVVGSGRVDRRGGIRFAKRSRVGKAILDGVDSGADVAIEL
jgi:ATPase